MSWPIIKKAGFDITFPDLITALNLAAGVIAIFSAISGDLLTARILVVAGMIFDYIDGKFARAYKQNHPFGQELDSLADVITFGLAPGVILLIMFPGTLNLVGAALFAIASAFRLARFNVQAAKKSNGYAGVPVPVAAFLLLALSFAPITALAAFIVMMVLSCLMLSTIPFPKV